MFFCYTYVVPINGLAPFRVLCRSMVEHPNGKSEGWMIDSLNWKFRSFLCLALEWHHFPRLAPWGARQTWGGGGGGGGGGGFFFPPLGGRQGKHEGGGEEGEGDFFFTPLLVHVCKYRYHSVTVWSCMDDRKTESAQKSCNCSKI